jgi:hypothetical protein
VARPKGDDIVLLVFGAKTQKNNIIILTAVKTSDLTDQKVF